MPAARAPNASILSSDGTSILAAINGWGIARLETNAGAQSGDAYRFVTTPLSSSFAGLTTAGAWPVKGGILVQFFRDPFSEPRDAGSQLSPQAPLSSSRLAFFDAEGKLASTPEPFSAGLRDGYELFALLPAGGAWYAELRKESSARVELKFYSLGDPLSAEAGLREIRKSDFEAALKPRALASLGGEYGDALKAAVAALGKGSWIVRLRDCRGGDDWYLSSGAAEDARAVYAWADGSKVLALRFDGWLAVAEVGGAAGASGAATAARGPAKAKLSRLEPPAEGAVFTAAAAAGDTLAAAWESGEFPNIEAAGLMVGRIARAAGRDTIQP